MKTYCWIFFFPVIMFGQSIDETLQQINSLKSEIAQNSVMVEQKIADLKRTNPLFAEQDAFESDAEYLGRLSRAMPQIDALRKQYMGDLWGKMAILRGKMFETSNIQIVIDPKQYDANNEKWPLRISHADYQREQVDIVIQIKKNQASALWKNWDKVKKIGVLSIDVGDKIGLAKLQLKEPISGFNFEFEFQPMKSFKYGGFVYSLSFSPDGKLLALGDRTVYIVNLESGQNVKSFKQEYSPLSIAFSPDGKFLAKGDYYSAHVFNLETGQEVDSFKHRGNVNSVAFSPDGKFLATGESNNKKANILNLVTGREVKSFTQSDVRAVAFSPDGKLLATGDGNGYAHIYNLETGQEVKSFAHERSVSSIAFSPNGKFLATGDNNGKAHIFDLETGLEVKSYVHQSEVTSVAFSPDGRYLCTGSSQTNVYDLNNQQFVSVKSIVWGSWAERNGLQKGDIIVSCGQTSIFDLNSFKDAFQNNYYSAFDVKIKRMDKFLSFKYSRSSDRNPGIDIEQHGDAFKQFSFPAKSVAFSPDGKYIAVASGENAYLFRTLLQVEEEVIAKKAISLPPSLTAKVTFSEPSGNNILDAIEKGKFIVELNNSGKGPAKGIIVKVTPERSENLAYNNSYVDEIPPGGTKIIEISIEAYIGINDGPHTFRFDFEEINGFPPTPSEVQFSTQAYLKPEMFIADVGIQDDNGNGKIESGEMISLSIRIGNKGKGIARSAYAKFYAGDNTFITDQYPKVVKIGELPFNQTIDIPLQFFVNDKTKEEIPLFVDLTEETNIAGAEKIRIPVNKSEIAKAISKTIVEGKLDQFGSLTIGGGLSVDIENDIPSGKEKNSNAVAVIFGIRDYASSDIPRVEYAKRDAQVMREYLIKVKGYDPKNILPQNPDELMTVGNMKSIMRQKLQSYLKPDGSSDVFVYYAGHGAPSTITQEPFFVPYDCDPNFVSDDNAYKMSDFYADIVKLKSKTKTVVIDACFSGQAGDGKAILKNASPALLKVKNPLLAGNGATIFQSSEASQVSNWYPEKKHGMFTYFFLKGLKGDADLNKDGTITVGEMENYVNDENNNLPYVSQREMQRKQRAVVSGDKSLIISSIK